MNAAISFLLGCLGSLVWIKKVFVDISAKGATDLEGIANGLSWAMNPIIIGTASALMIVTLNAFTNLLRKNIAAPPKRPSAS